MPGMSCPREMRPTPMAPTLMRLLGAYCPNTEAGTMAGKPRAAAAPRPVFRTERRVTFIFIEVFILPSLLILESDELRVLLRLDHEFRRQQALFLVLGYVGTIHDVCHKLRAERELHAVAVDIARLLAVN